MIKRFPTLCIVFLILGCETALSSESFIVCRMTKDVLSNGVHEPSEYDLRIMLDDSRRIIKADDVHGMFTTVTSYNDLEIKGRMEPFDFNLDREKGMFARAAKTRSGAIVEGGPCHKIERPKAKF